MTKAVDWSQLPQAMPGGDLMPHMSARMRRTIVDTVFQASGGADRLLAWVEKNDENYETFVTKLWGPGQAKAVSAEVGLGGDVEELLAKLDAGEHARVINAHALSEEDSEAA